MKGLSKILGYIKEYKTQVVLYFITVILQIVFSAFSLAMLAPSLQVLFSGTSTFEPAGGSGILGQITAYTNSLILRYDKVATLAILIGVIIGFSILKNLFIYLSLCLLNPIRNAVIKRLREDLFSKILALPIGFFTEENKGDLISRMTNDVNEVQQSIVSTLEVFIKEAFTIIFFITSLVIINARMTLFLILMLPVAALIGRIGRSLRRHSNAVQEETARMLGVMDETIAGMRVVKSFNAEGQQKARFDQINENEFRIRNGIAYRRELGSPLSETMGIIIVGVVLWYGGNLIFKQQTSPEWLFTFIAMLSQVINPFKNLSSAFMAIRKGEAALVRIDHILAQPNPIAQKADARPVTAFERDLVFENVSFSYGSTPILTDINLRIEKGKTVALVGASGAGKSTLVDLIPRFYDVSAGRILLDGVDIRDYVITDLRELIGIVNQDPILFNDTLLANIALGKPGSTPQEVEDAIEVAHAGNFIHNKKDGLQTGAGDRGNRLSGGERQRITIARAVLKNPPILILDEATSSLDTYSERTVQEAINRLMHSRTSIVIAHRLSTVQNADEIIVLEKGRIIERGTHDTLLARKGEYHKLIQMQQMK